MALVISIRPIDRNPDAGESRSAYCEGEGTAQVQYGAGTLMSITVGVAGTLLTLYDAVEGDSLNDDNTIMVIPTADVTEPSKFHGPPIAFGRGLLAVTTGAGTALTIGFRGGQTTSTRRYYP